MESPATIIPHAPNDPVILDAPELASSQAAARTSRRWIDRRGFWITLLALTLLGGFLRYWRLSHQSIWWDESSTIERIKDQFSDVLERLKGQGFPPGWYAALWAYTKVCAWLLHSPLRAFSPAVLRALPAFFGTCTIPAICFLARQFTDRRGALIAALLAAVNPFLIYYARDLKMYATFYLFVALTMALFFQWQQNRRLGWWVLFLLAGAVMVSLHGLGWFLLILQLIFLLTRRRVRGLDIPLWLTAVGVMSILPLWWYLNGTDWITRVAENNYDGGVGWNAEYTAMSWKTVGSLFSEHFLGYLLPTYPPDQILSDWFHLGNHFVPHLATRSIPWLITLEWWVAGSAAAILALGVLPWRGWRSRWNTSTLTQGRWWWLLLWIALPVGALALTWIPDDSKWYAYTWGKINHDPTPTWEPRYLGLICPALLVSAALLLRRLPTWPVRSIGISGIAAAMLISSLSNQLIYRQFPWNPVEAMTIPLIPPHNPDAMYVFAPRTRNSEGGDRVALLYGLGVAPSKWNGGTIGDYFHYYSSIDRDDPDGLASRIARRARNDKTQTIIVTDLDGDIDTGTISDAAMAKLMPQFRLTQTAHFRWYLEWHYYLFNPVRVRVWQRIPKPAAPAIPKSPAATAGATRGN